jgi:hypothetical protein
MTVSSKTEQITLNSAYNLMKQSSESMEMTANCSRRATTLEDDLEAFLDEFINEKVMNGKLEMSSTPWIH